MHLHVTSSNNAIKSYKSGGKHKYRSRYHKQLFTSKDASITYLTHSKSKLNIIHYLSLLYSFALPSLYLLISSL